MSIRVLPFGLGLIEAFYGRQWSESDRLQSLGFLAGAGYSYYVYAPKGDRELRRCWRDNWSAERERHIEQLAARATGSGLRWGIGLSPLGLAEDFSAARADFLRKLRYLNRFAPDILCLLFDDMPRGVERLAEVQLAIVDEALGISDADHLIVCPSYYSNDPVLERLFGAMPAAYLESIGRGLPPEAGVFWTGERVCSTHYAESDLRAIAQRLGRCPVLWDNYPVNDGARSSAFLRLHAYTGRDAGLRRLVDAHFVNPMNQCHLSRIPLASLPMLYHGKAAYDAESAFRTCATEQAGASLGAMLVEDCALLQEVGLAAMSEEQKQWLQQRYAGFDSPFARELLAWSRGEYAFDPACLTD